MINLMHRLSLSALAASFLFASGVMAQTPQTPPPQPGSPAPPGALVSPRQFDQRRGLIDRPAPPVQLQSPPHQLSPQAAPPPPSH